MLLPNVDKLIQGNEDTGGNKGLNVRGGRLPCQ